MADGRRFDRLRLGFRLVAHAPVIVGAHGGGFAYGVLFRFKPAHRFLGIIDPALAERDVVVPLAGDHLARAGQIVEIDAHQPPIGPLQRLVDGRSAELRHYSCQRPTKSVAVVVVELMRLHRSGRSVPATTVMSTSEPSKRIAATMPAPPTQIASGGRPPPPAGS